MHNELLGLSRPVIIKAAMSAYSPDGLFKCSRPPPPRSFCMFRFYTMIRLFVLLLSVHSKRSKTNMCKGRDTSSLVAAVALMEHNSRNRELDGNLLRLLLL